MNHFELFYSLNKNNVRYLLCGGLAVNIYGVVRSTAHLDILLDFTEENIENFEITMKEFGYAPLIPLPLKMLTNVTERLKLKEEKSLIAYSYQNSGNGLMSLDVHIECPYSFDDLWNKKETPSSGKDFVHIVSLERLLGMKKYSNRIQDREDITNLMIYRSTGNSFQKPQQQYETKNVKKVISWLESMNNFLNAFQTTEAKQIAKNFRNRN